MFKDLQNFGWGWKLWCVCQENIMLIYKEEALNIKNYFEMPEAFVSNIYFVETGF